MIRRLRRSILVNEEVCLIVDGQYWTLDYVVSVIVHSWNSVHGVHLMPYAYFLAWGFEIHCPCGRMWLHISFSMQIMSWLFTLLIWLSVIYRVWALASIAGQKNYLACLSILLVGWMSFFAEYIDSISVVVIFEINILAVYCCIWYILFFIFCSKHESCVHLKYVIAGIGNYIVRCFF